VGFTLTIALSILTSLYVKNLKTQTNCVFLLHPYTGIQTHVEDPASSIQSAMQIREFFMDLGHTIAVSIYWYFFKFHSLYFLFSCLLFPMQTLHNT